MKPQLALQDLHACGTDPVMAAMILVPPDVVCTGRGGWWKCTPHDVHMKAVELFSSDTLCEGCSLPGLVAVCNGDLSTAVQYQGELKAGPLREFFRSFEGGRRCAKSVKLDARTDFAKLKTGQLKQLLEDRGVKCPECLERSDYVSRLQELL